ncbi:hypothetical protein DFJ73DRAFT_806364 [Zopfochytrium polystomum]|nr:hypothetical protein DFJ73DRAFT_806364 [Zopfochytrium polystomum]
MSSDDASFDGSPYARDCFQSVAHAVAVVTILASHWDTLEKLRNPLLFWSLVAAGAGHLTYLVGNAANAAIFARDADFNEYNMRNSVFAAADSVADFGLIFNSTYRTILIAFPQWKRKVLIPAVILVFQAVVEILANAYWWKVGQYGDDQSVFDLNAATFTLVGFDSVVETSFFVFAQYKIVCSMGRSASLVRHILRVIIRCICFVAALLLQYLALLGYIRPGNAATSPFLYQGPSLMLLVLLSDSLYIRDIIERYANNDIMSVGVSTSRIAKNSENGVF